MKQPRPGVNAKVVVTPTPAKIYQGSVIQAGPVIQNTNATDIIVYIYQGQADPPVKADAEYFILQQYAMMDFSESAQQNSIWAWTAEFNCECTVNNAS